MSDIKNAVRLAIAALDPTIRFEVVTPDGADIAKGGLIARVEAMRAPSCRPSAWR